MTIRFAAPKSSIRNRMECTEARAACSLPANDNASEPATEIMLHAALRHFADHGLAAALHARKQAVAARKLGDTQTYNWWLEICRALDRRMATEIDHRAAGN